MKMSLTPDRLTAYVARQVGFAFPDGDVEGAALRPYVSAALERADYCFSRVKDKYFFDGEETIFNHLHSDQYAMFLYYLANTIWRMNGDLSLATKVFYLNKSLNAVDIFYEVQLPDIFLLVHPLGTILGRGKYSNYFVAYQRCTVGANPERDYPVIEEGVVLYGGSMLIGRCHVQKNCWIAPGTLMMDLEVPSDRVVFGRHPSVQFKPTVKSVIERNFR